MISDKRNQKELFYVGLSAVGAFIEVTPALRGRAMLDACGQRKTALDLLRGAGCIPKQDGMQA